MESYLNHNGIRCEQPRLLSLLNTYLADADASAAICGSRSLTRGQLATLAIDTAARLRDAGAMPGDFILCPIATGLELPVAWLASLAAECVIVPIDASWPASRLKEVSDLTGARVVFISPKFDIDLAGARYVRIDASETVALPLTTEITGSNLRHDRPVYGFFTSGSTGVPKCAVNYESGLVNRLLYMSEIFGQGHIVYQNSTHTFDSSIWQILWPLVSQGTFVLPSERRALDFAALARVFRSEAVSMTDFVPSILRLLMQQVSQGAVKADDFRSLRYLLVGGEALDEVLARSFRVAFPECVLVNTYGHTEASIGMMFHQIPASQVGPVSIGHPIAGTFARICDENLQQVDPGVEGEIVVGGVCVGSGYLGRDELTAQVFVPNPFEDVPGNLVYRTGDLGVTDPKGLTWYHGRRDLQVKINGVRVELEELEVAATKLFPQLSVAAFTFTAGAGTKALGLAYAGQPDVTPDDLLHGLRKWLPASHLPRKVLGLQALPLTAAEKVDRRALTAMSEKPQLAEPVDHTADQIQAAVLASCGRIAGADAVLREDSDLFESGVDSLAAFEILLDLHRQGHRSIQLSDLYEARTPRAIADLLATPGRYPRGEEEAFLPEYTSQKRFPAGVQAARCFLVTGASGFLGLHVLDVLARNPGHKIYAIVRAHAGKAPLAQIEQAADRAGLDRSQWKASFVAVGGDLAAPAFALATEQWEQIAEEVDCIYHVGAKVHFLESYRALKPINVDATQQLIELCQHGKAKSLMYISTLAAARLDPIVARANGHRVRIEEIERGGVDGYIISKFAAEQLVRGAVARGLQAAIFRVDDLLPAIQKPVLNDKSVSHRFMQLCLSTRTAPTDAGGVRLLPVDDAAERIVRYALPTPQTPCPSECPTLVLQGTRVVSLHEVFTAQEEALQSNYTYMDYSDFFLKFGVSCDREAVMLKLLLPEPLFSNRIFGEFDPSDWSPDKPVSADAAIVASLFVRSKNLVGRTS